MELKELTDLIGRVERGAAFALVNDFAQKWFGPAAVKLEVYTESEYNDEGGYYNYVSGVSAYDVAGKLISPVYETITEEESAAYDDPDEIPAEEDFEEEYGEIASELEMLSSDRGFIDLTKSIPLVDLSEYQLIHTPK